MYTLTSSAVLAPDLLRQEEAAALIEIVQRALHITDDELETLAALSADQGPLEQVRETAARVARRPSMLDALRELRAALGRGDSEVLSLAHARLQSVAMLSLADLHRVLSTEVLAGARPDLAPAVTAVCDAASAAWCRADLAPEDAAALDYPWQVLSAAAWELPEDAFGPRTAQVQALCAALSRTTAEQLDEISSAQQRQSSQSSWALDMHSACLAANLCGRVAPLASAQLEAARSLLATGQQPRYVAGQVGLAVPGAVHAVALADVLDTATFDRLTMPVRLVLGPVWELPQAS